MNANVHCATAEKEDQRILRFGKMLPLFFPVCLSDVRSSSSPFCASQTQNKAQNTLCRSPSTSGFWPQRTFTGSIFAVLWRAAGEKGKAGERFGSLFAIHKHAHKSGYSGEGEGSPFYDAGNKLRRQQRQNPSLIVLSPPGEKTSARAIEGISDAVLLISVLMQSRKWNFSRQREKKEISFWERGEGDVTFLHFLPFCLRPNNPLLLLPPSSIPAVIQTLHALTKVCRVGVCVPLPHWPGEGDQHLLLDRRRRTLLLLLGCDFVIKFLVSAGAVVDVAQCDLCVRLLLNFSLSFQSTFSPRLLAPTSVTSGTSPPTGPTGSAG